MINKNEIRVVELFAGVGGFRVGLQKASNAFKVVFSNQFEPSTKTQHASDIYVSRFGRNGHVNKDINLIPTTDIPFCDLLVGGFPCQDYSVASSLKNAKGIVGKKGVLWWQIYRIIKEQGDKSPKFLLFENVDRLLISPAKNKGRDFAIILSSLNELGYLVEWRVINAADYGMPQKRKRVFILAYKVSKDLNIKLDNSLLNKAFPIKDKTNFIKTTLQEDIVEISNSFQEIKFLNNGIMFNNQILMQKVTPEHNGTFTKLKDILIDEKDVPEEFYLTEETLTKFKFFKDTQSFERVNKTTGFKYLYKQGKMSFPDDLEKPSRTIITGEGGTSASRFKHVVLVNGKYRRLTPIELERLNMFPDNHTQGCNDIKRAFLMGNALVCGVVERIGKVIKENITVNN